MKRRTIAVENLARVEGEGAMHIRIVGDDVEHVELRLFEPPRFFEAFLRGRHLSEAPDITARICGICPVAYQMSAVHAIEQALGVRVEPGIRALRRLLYCGEWIESHALHIYMLHAPDFLGYESAVHMAADHREVVERGLRLKKIGNAIVERLGGRAIHPVNVKVGGFYRLPDRARLAAHLEDLEWAREAAAETVRWTAGFDFPDISPAYELVALRHADEYPMNEGRIVSNRGLDIDPSRFNERFEEQHVPYTTALHAMVRERGSYLVGPTARYGLNFDHLPPHVQELAMAVGADPKDLNPFRSIVVRSIETLYACEEAIRLIRSYEPPRAPSAEVVPRAGVGHACTEAPRGMLYHRYEVGADGLIANAQIVPPTSQNQKTIEDDLHLVASRYVSLPDEELKWRCEQTIRNYDPCISCSTHFLKVTVERR